MSKERDTKTTILLIVYVFVILAGLFPLLNKEIAIKMPQSFMLLIVVMIILAMAMLINSWFKIKRRDWAIIPWFFCIIIISIEFFSVYFDKNGLVSTKSGCTIHSAFISLYFSVATFTTLGYGDYYPATDFGRIYSSLEAFSGYIMLGLFVAVLVSDSD